MSSEAARGIRTFTLVPEKNKIEQVCFLVGREKMATTHTETAWEVGKRRGRSRGPHKTRRLLTFKEQREE